MSIKIMDQVFDLKGVTPTEKLILLSLADHADESGRCYPSIDRLSLRTCLSERALQVNIRTLTQKGFITIAKGGGRGRANEYIVSANPAQETPFEKPRFKNTVSHVENPAPRALNPAPDAPQSSLTIIEPSEVYIGTADASKPKRAVRLPENWVPSVKNISDAQKKGFSHAEIGELSEQFRDHHLARGTAFKDWDAGWRTWVNNARKFAKPARNTGASRAVSNLRAGFQASAADDRSGDGTGPADYQLPF